MKSLLITITTAILFSTAVTAAPPSKSKFYDFGDQVIDGEIKKPTGEYFSDRQRARFDRLTNLKKSFLPKMFITSKNKLFK